MPLSSPDGYLNFTNAVPYAVKMVATSNVGIGTSSPKYALDVHGTSNTGPLTVSSLTIADGAIVGDVSISGNLALTSNVNLLHTSNTSSLRVNSNVVTEFPRSKKLIKYPRVALTGPTSGGYTAQTSSINLTTQDAWYAFDNNEPADNNSRWRGASPRYTNSGATPPSEYLFTGSEAGDWISIQLPEKMKLVYYTMTGIHTHTPQEGVIYGYDSDTSTWHKVSTFYFNTTSYPVNNTPLFSPEFHTEEGVGLYSKYAMIVTKTNGSDAPSLYEWKLYGIPEYDPDADGVDVKVTSYPNVPNTDWLEVYYDAKDYSDVPTSVTDKTGNGNDATTIGSGVGFDSTYKAFTFDGTANGKIAGTHPLSDTSPSLTMSFWFKRISKVSTGWNYVATIGTSTTGQMIGLTINPSDQFNFSNYSDGTLTEETIILGQWYHVTLVANGEATFNSTNFRIYINAREPALSSHGGGSTTTLTGNQLTLGTNTNSGEPFNGSIANFRLFNRALTSDEIWQLYAYQKEYFGHGDLSMTFKAGRLGIGTLEPRSLLQVGDEPFGPGSRPMFRAVNNSASTLSYDATDGAKIFTTEFNTTQINVTNSYSTSTGRFTAPIPGYYFFEFQLLMGVAVGHWGTVQPSLYLNGVNVNKANSSRGLSYLWVNNPNISNPAYSYLNTPSCRAILYLNRGDYVQAGYPSVSSSTAATSFEYSKNYAFFQGYLLST